MNPRKFFEKLVKRVQRTGESLGEVSARIMREVEEGKRNAPKPAKRVGQYTKATADPARRRAAIKRTKATRAAQRRKGIYRRPQA